MEIFRTHFQRILISIVLVGLGAFFATWFMPAELASVERQIAGIPDSDIAAHQLRPAVLCALFFIPALTSVIYSLGGTMDRYIAREFAGIFGICLGALFAVWLLVDLSDNISEFRASKNALQTMGLFYFTRLPAIALLLMPYSLLLSLLYSLGKLSTNREITAMIQSGRSVVRVTLPLILAGSILSVLSAGLNYHWAPTVEGSVDKILATATGKNASEASNVLYLNPEERRLWKVGQFSEDYFRGGPLSDVEVTTTREDRTMESRLYAKTATWDRAGQLWTFQNPVLARFESGQPAMNTTGPNPLVVKNWTETPWQLIKPGLSAAYMGIPDLNTWLAAHVENHQFIDAAPYLTQWHYRWALPLCSLPPR